MTLEAGERQRKRNRKRGRGWHRPSVSLGFGLFVWVGHPCVGVFWMLLQGTHTHTQELSLKLMELYTCVHFSSRDFSIYKLKRRQFSSTLYCTGIWVGEWIWSHLYLLNVTCEASGVHRIGSEWKVCENIDTCPHINHTALGLCSAEGQHRNQCLCGCSGANMWGGSVCVCVCHRLMFLCVFHPELPCSHWTLHHFQPLTPSIHTTQVFTTASLSAPHFYQWGDFYLPVWCCF